MRTQSTYTRSTVHRTQRQSIRQVNAKAKKRGKSGKGEEAADSYLITVWMPAMNQKICFVPTDSFVLRPPPPAGQRGHGWTNQKNAQRTGATLPCLALPNPIHSIPSHPFLPSISVSLLCLCHPVWCLQEERKMKKNKCKRKAKKDLRAILDNK